MLDVTVWGSRGSIPSSGERFNRYGGATTCLELECLGAGEGTPSRIIIDCGTGMAELGKNWGDRAPEALVLQTHMHWDHVQGFPFFGPLFNPAAQFEFWSVRREGMSLRDVLSGQMSGPMFPIGIEIFPAGLTWNNIDPIGSAQLGELQLSWTELAHPSGSTAYRLHYRGATVVFTGDVEIQNGCRDRLLSFAQGADLLIMDSQYLPEEYPSRRGFGHSTYEDAVQIAQEASVGSLLLTHHDPSHDDDTLDRKRAQAQAFAQGGLSVDTARDGLTCSASPAHAAGLAPATM